MKFLKKCLVLTMCLSVLLLSACNNKSAVDNKKLEEINVVLDWYPNAVHSFIYDAIKKGYYEQEGLKVNIVFPSNTNDAISLTSAGKAQIGIYYPHDVIQVRAQQDVPVKIIGSIVQSPLNIVMSLAEKNIKSPKDFEGKTIGYAGTALSEAMIKSMMKNESVNEDTVKFLDVGFDLMSSMTTKKVDATIGCLVNHEVPQLEEEGFKVNYFTVDKYGVPTYPELVFVTSDNLIKEKKELISKFLRASKKGFEDMKNSKDETLDILLENQNKENFPLSKTVEQKSMDTILPLMQNDNAKFLYINENDIQNMINWEKQEGIITKDIKVEDVVQVIQ